MDIEKCDLGTVISFGSLQDFSMKLQQEGKRIADVIDQTDKNGMSLLEISLAAGNFDVAKFLLTNNSKVNIVSKEGCNEFHYIAGNLRYEGALETAELLLEKGTSLVHKDSKYGNPAFFTLCQEVFKFRSEEALNFLEKCLKRIDNYDDCNRAGYSIRMLIDQRGTERLKQIMENRE